MGLGVGLIGFAVVVRTDAFASAGGSAVLLLAGAVGALAAGLLTGAVTTKLPERGPRVARLREVSIPDYVQWDELWCARFTAGCTSVVAVVGWVALRTGVWQTLAGAHWVSHFLRRLWSDGEALPGGRDL